jgi:hypothetical protein
VIIDIGQGAAEGHAFRGHQKGPQFDLQIPGTAYPTVVMTQAARMFHVLYSPPLSMPAEQSTVSTFSTFLS